MAEECIDGDCSLTDETQEEAQREQVEQWNAELQGKSPQEVIAWALATFGADHTALSSSFGIQAAVMLHLVHEHAVSECGAPRVPVIWVDTGYLPKETYQYAAQLEKDWDLDLRVYQSALTPARMEALYGKLWETQTTEAHYQYGAIRKVEPMQRAIKELQVKALLVGVRAQQTSHREGMQSVNIADGYLKICPILHWTKEDVQAYVAAHNLPPHPLQAQGYTTIGDWHSSAPATGDTSNGRATRFHGVSQECGMHLDVIVQPQGAQSDSAIMKASEQELIDKTQDPNRLVIFSKPTCKYCLAAKALFKSREMKYEDFTVGVDVSVTTLQRIVGRPVSTVPQIYLNGKYVGGYTDLCATLKVPPRLP